MNYCSQCGQPVALRVPADDTRPRHVCGACGAVHYVNPKLIAGCVVESADGRILLCRRAIEPRSGYWTVPAGFMELGETGAEAAARETREEALAEVTDLALHCVVDVPHVSQVHLMYRGRLAGTAFGVGHETLETVLLPAEAIPWADLAFASVHATLERFLADRARGRFEVHPFTVERRSP